MLDAKKTTILERITKYRSGEMANIVSEDRYYKPLSNLILRSETICARAQDAWDFKSLADFGTEDFCLRGSVSAGPDARMLSGLSEEYARCLFRWLLYHDEGLCLFEKLENGSYFLARKDNPDFIVASYFITNQDFPQSLVVAPKWMENLYINRKNLEAYETFWYSDPGLSDPKYSARKALKREAVLRASGLLDVDTDSSDALVKVGRLTDQVERLNVELAEANTGTSFADHEHWPEELDIAMMAWRAALSGAEQAAKKPGVYIREWLEKTYGKKLTKTQKERISTVANWDKTPGPK